MNKFTNRSTEEEIMDDLTCSGEVVEQTLRELDFINQWLGGNSVTVDGLKKLLKNKTASGVSVADVGCGSGDMLNRIARSFQKNKIQLALTGIDANPNIIAYAQKQHDRARIRFVCENILNEEFRNKKFDVVLATLFLHHFSNEKLVDILRLLHQQARIGIVINDLHRHPLAYYSIKWLTRLFSKSTMVKFDAPLSVLRGFTRRELRQLLKQAGITTYTLTWKWAFRWQVIIFCGNP